MRSPWLLGMATAIVLAMPATASAQSTDYMYRLNLTSIGATTCTTLLAQTTISGDLDWILPPFPGNLRRVRSVNGSVFETEVTSITPFNFDNSPVASASLSLSAPTPLPYTATLEVIPLLNGLPVGIGFFLTWNCDAQGGGTFEFVQITAPPALGVPTMSGGGLLLLTVLLGLAAARRPRRRASG